MRPPGSLVYLPGKAGWLLLISDPKLGPLDGGIPVAAFALECMAAIPGDGWPVTLMVVDGTGGGPNPLGIYNAGQYVNSIAVTRGQVVAEVGVEGPWQGRLTISEAVGRLAWSLKPDKGSKAADGWKDVELWARS